MPYTTYSGLLKQPDKHKSGNRKLPPYMRRLFFGQKRVSRIAPREIGLKPDFSDLEL